MNEKVVCTIITKNYLPFARALYHTLREHNPNLDLYVLLADEPDGYFNPTEEPFKIIFLEDLPDQDLVRNICFYYTTFELCCALRGILHEYIYENEIANSWLFLDSDILVYNSLEEIFEQLRTASILLNPHLISPVNHEYISTLEVSILVSGIYNAGFLGLRRSEETRKFIKWFKHRLMYYGFNRRGKDIFNLLFVDQLWLNLVPHFFNEVDFLVHSGANVGYWNLVSREISSKNNIYFIDEKPLLFIHFSGWNISQPLKVSTHLTSEKHIKLWKGLAENYKQLLLSYGYENCKNYPNIFTSFINGQEITKEMRYLYYEKVISNEVNMIDPFSSLNYFNLKKIQKKHSSLVSKGLRKLSKKLFGK